MSLKLKFHRYLDRSTPGVHPPIDRDHRRARGNASRARIAHDIQIYNASTAYTYMRLCAIHNRGVRI